MAEWLLSDLHVHTTMSDGTMEVREVIDFYASLNFDVIAITDHVLDALSEKFPKMLLPFPCNWIKGEDGYNIYYKLLKNEAERAWRKYKMIVISGIEFTSYIYNSHVVALDIHEYIKPKVKLEKTLEEVKKTNSIILGVHPWKNYTKMGGGLWNNRKYATYIDVWEVGNGLDFFPHVIKNNLRYLANTDFHGTRKENGIKGWKNVIYAERNIQSIKEAILSQRVALYKFE
jgi:hypothetical protein